MTCLNNRGSDFVIDLVVVLDFDLEADFVLDFKSFSSRRRILDIISAILGAATSKFFFSILGLNDDLSNLNSGKTLLIIDVCLTHSPRLVINMSCSMKQTVCYLLSVNIIKIH